jgi:hypothetical protein
MMHASSGRNFVFHPYIISSLALLFCSPFSGYYLVFWGQLFRPPSLNSRLQAVIRGAVERFCGGTREGYLD